jgi:hypothetical protein
MVSSFDRTSNFDHDSYSCYPFSPLPEQLTFSPFLGWTW